MFKKALAGVNVAVLAADGFEQVEVTKPVKRLLAEGANVRIISLRPGRLRGMNLLYPGKKITVDDTVFTADASDYSALLLPGGFVSPDFLRQSDEVLRFVRAFEQARKPIATLCHGPEVLISAGLVRNRTLTSWPGIADDVRNAGGAWIDEAVVRDDNWVASRSPMDLPAFNAAMVELFAERAPRMAHAPARKLRFLSQLARLALVGGATWALGRRLAALTS